MAMQGQFSGVVKLSDVSDFIETSQNCVVASVAPSNRPAELPIPTDPVKISLRDCLACSGCVTTAETALLENQSTQEFIRQLENKETVVVVSISSEARAALSVSLALKPIHLMKCLSGFLRWMGVHAVYDLNDANDLTLIAAADEFVRRFQERQSSGTRPLNLIASSCPGWICYVEKTHGAWALDHLATTRSAQATMGKLVKRGLKDRWKVSRIYHCTVMSCFDKKLEASRSQFLGADGITPEVDVCLTSTEMISLINDFLPADRRFEAFADSDGAFLDTLDGERDAIECLYGIDGSSGGLLEYVYRTAARKIFDVDIPNAPLSMKPLRNSQFREIALETASGEVLMHFASVYGFRNIQAFIQKLKRGKCPYDYIEIMACPSGCTNGGGQPKTSDGVSLLDRIQETHRQDVTLREPGSNRRISAFLDMGLDTSYQEVLRSSHTAAMDW